MAEPDLGAIFSGPAQVLIADADIGHTQGGVELNVAPKNRIRNVDIYGDGPVAVIHLGDDVKVTAPLAEYTALTLGNAYVPGNNQLAAATNKYLGFGRKAGFVYPTADLKIAPIITGQTAHKIHLYKATPVGNLQMMYRAQDDRMVKIEWTGIIDDSKTDGELIGAIALAGTVP